MVEKAQQRAHSKPSFQGAVNFSMQHDFTMGGIIPWSLYVIDDSDDGMGSHYSFSRKEIDIFVSRVKEISPSKKG